MSVAELLSGHASLGEHPLVIVLGLTALVLIGGFRWSSQPHLTLEARRLVRNLVLVGWSVYFALIVVLAAAFILTPSSPGRGTSSQQVATLQSS